MEVYGSEVEQYNIRWLEILFIANGTNYFFSKMM